MPTFVQVLLALACVLLLALVLLLAWRLRQLRFQPAPLPEPAPAPVVDEYPALFNATAATLDAGLIVVDTERQVRYVNGITEELLNLRANVVLGKGLITLVRDYQAEAMVREVLRDGEPRETTIQPLFSGRTFRLRCRSLAPFGELQGALLVIRDVTQLSNLERARRDLVANVSHELRTPLASLKLLVETLQSDPPVPVAQRMLGQASQEIDAVTQLVDELYELSQIESGRVTLQLAPTNLKPLVDRSIERILPQATRKGLQVQSTLAPELPAVLVDEDRVGQVLLNLLHNAVKFTPQDGSITVAAEVVTIKDVARPIPVFVEVPEPGLASLPEQRAASVSEAVQLLPGQWLLVSVSDTGIGIPASDLPRIFERFYKVDRARTRNAGGTGLGLAIAKHLIEGHGGRIWASSEEGKGSTFCIALPAA